MERRQPSSSVSNDPDDGLTSSGFPPNSEIDGGGKQKELVNELWHESPLLLTSN